jgi:hypothetical protein
VPIITNTGFSRVCVFIYAPMCMYVFACTSSVAMKNYLFNVCGFCSNSVVKWGLGLMSPDPIASSSAIITMPSYRSAITVLCSVTHTHMPPANITHTHMPMSPAQSLCRPPFAPVSAEARSPPPPSPSLSSHFPVCFPFFILQRIFMELTNPIPSGVPELCFFILLFRSPLLRLPRPIHSIDVSRPFANTKLGKRLELNAERNTRRCVCLPGRVGCEQVGRLISVLRGSVAWSKVLN